MFVHASIVFAVENVEEKKRLLKERAINVAGQRVYLANYHNSTPTTQCNKCYKLGHNGLACREKLGCKYCLSSRPVNPSLGGSPFSSKYSAKASRLMMKFAQLSELL